MTTEDPHTQLYNNLPLINNAHDIFVSNDGHRIIPRLWQLLRKFEGKFGICLVRRHCDIVDGEHMVADGPVTQPLPKARRYPLCWVDTGKDLETKEAFLPFEFSPKPTESPPAELFRDFRKIVGDLRVLGIFFVPEEDRRRTRHGFEYPRGRKNITRHDEVVITSWRHSDTDGQAMNRCAQTCCEGLNHAGSQTSLHFSFTPHPDGLFSEPEVPPESQEQLMSAILDITSKTLTAMRNCTSVLPRMLVLVTHFGDCCVRWTGAKLDVPVDAIYMTDTTSLLESLTGTSTTIHDLYTDIVSVASTIERFKFDRVRFKGTEELAIASQLYILDAQLALLSKQVSAVRDLMDKLPNVDPAATRLREWATQVAMAKNLVHVEEGVVTRVLSISSGLVASLKEDTGLVSLFTD
ncbi:hypothetical protein MVEN_01188900 [Mycena venus]|uniref:Uncharacterized protein n=1 Tax=Mycena venus TaxID=2733690 RepID=A0A8H6Y5L4_9AGAR|nr:hypothetical protein MVEN_01188900 [Mycena venus]